jgi:hypothetical protein
MSSTPWELIDKVYTLFTTMPYSFFAIPIVWGLMILVFKKGLNVHVSPWIALLTLIVSVGIVIGILLAFF